MLSISDLFSKHVIQESWSSMFSSVAVVRYVYYDEVRLELIDRAYAVLHPMVRHSISILHGVDAYASARAKHAMYRSRALHYA